MSSIPLKRNITISLVSGAAITVVLFSASVVTVRMFPYRDLPNLPKPFFLYALAPGILAAELWDNPGWKGNAAFFITNSVAWATMVFCVPLVITAAGKILEHARKRQ